VSLYNGRHALDGWAFNDFSARPKVQ